MGSEEGKDKLVERSVPTKSLARDMRTLSRIVGYLRENRKKSHILRKDGSGA